MNLNLSLYKSIIPSLATIIKNNPHVKDGELVSLCSIGTGAHIVVCAYFLSFLSGDLNTYKEITDRLIKFYKIESVSNLEDFFDESGKSKEIVEGNSSLS